MTVFFVSIWWLQGQGHYLNIWSKQWKITLKSAPKKKTFRCLIFTHKVSPSEKWFVTFYTELFLSICLLPAGSYNSVFGFWGMTISDEFAQVWKKLRYMLQKSIFKIVFVFGTFLCEESGADLGVSRGGGADFQKIFRKIDRPFFRSTKVNFRALPKH